MPAATSEDAIYQKSLLVHNHSNLFTGLAEVKNVQRSPNSVRARIIQHSTNLGDPKHSELYNWFNIIRCLDWWINIEYNNTSSFIHMHEWQFPQIKYIFGTFSVVKTREIKVACTSRQSNTTSEIYNETGKHVWKVGLFFFFAPCFIRVHNCLFLHGFRTITTIKTTTLRGTGQVYCQYEIFDAVHVVGYR